MDARLYYATEPLGDGPVEELSVVRLLRLVENAPAGHVPEGALGTVVSVYGAGEMYEVEFESPAHALLTLSRGDSSAVPELTRERVIAASKLVSDRRC